ncbi:MAG: DUF6537 domain-containing protein, partial [Candidatus Entotheonellia bacterium]
DILVATSPTHLERASADRTRAVVSSSQIPTGDMVRRKDTPFPAVAGLMQKFEGCTRTGANIFLDVEALAEELFGDHMAANLLTLGAAYQAGAIPLEAESIEETIRLNGVAVEMNLHAFRWGRLYVQDRAAVERELERLRPREDPARSALSELASRVPESATSVRELREFGNFQGEVRRLAEIRVPELILYQNVTYARQYVECVRRVVDAERERTPGRTELAEAVARYLFKLMAYKDEYEVARLLLKEAFFQQVRTEFGEDVQLAFNLHPPLLRALGLKHKIRLGPWSIPLFKLLRALRWMRRTPLDLFGFAKVRRVERALIGEYRRMIESILPHLSEDTHNLAVQMAELPDLIRGYEGIKLASVDQFRQKAQELRQQFSETRSVASALSSSSPLEGIGAKLSE